MLHKALTTRLLAALVPVVAALSILGTPAAASTSARAISAPMTLDCVNMSAKARAYADEHHLCDQVSGVMPMDPAYGDCGVSTIYILDGYDTGIAQVNEGVGSTQGAIVAVSYGVNWYNYTTHNGAGFTGWSSNFSTTWSHTDYINSGSGYVSAQLFGVVTLYWGGHCTINYPYDENTIS